MYIELKVVLLHWRNLLSFHTWFPLLSMRRAFRFGIIPRTIRATQTIRNCLSLSSFIIYVELFWLVIVFYQIIFILYVKISDFCALGASGRMLRLLAVTNIKKRGRNRERKILFQRFAWPHGHRPTPRYSTLHFNNLFP